MKALVGMALVASLAACDQGPEFTRAGRIAEAPPGPPKAFAFEEKTDQIEFVYSWSIEAAAVPELDRKFRADLEKSRANLIAGAEAEESDFSPFMLSTQYRTSGQTQRLLSLSVESGSYTGGAHGNFGVRALLWDRAERKEIRFQDLFERTDGRDLLLGQRWCDALNRARNQKRGTPPLSRGPFDVCPSLDYIAIIPTDKDGIGRFETLKLIAAPNVAGPLTEGTYEIEMPVTTYLIAALKREYRPSFEAQGVQ